MAQQPITGPKLVVSAAITEADTNTTVNAIEIPAGAFIPPKGVSIYIPEVFAGGTPSIDVGDSTDPDGWIDTTEITETTIGTYSGVAAALAENGKYYATADQIEVVVATGLTGGTAYVIAQYYDFSDLDVAAVT
jgi:hypothetical protein